MNFLKKLFGQTAKDQNKSLNDAEIIEIYRSRFKHSLTGKWASAEGTFSMQSDEFEFFENGKGSWLSCGGSYEDTIHFEWREKAPFTIEMREEDMEHWLEIEYEFKVMENDMAKEVILCQKNADTFYMAVTRISFCGSIK